MWWRERNGDGDGDVDVDVGCDDGDGDGDVVRMSNERREKCRMRDMKTNPRKFDLLSSTHTLKACCPGEHMGVMCVCAYMCFCACVCFMFYACVCVRICFH